MIVAFLLSTTFAGALAVAADGFVGAQTCRPCHPVQFQQQAATGHARTLSRAAGRFSSGHLAERFSSVSNFRKGFEFSLENHDEVLSVKIRDARSENAEIEIPLDWAFGSGTHGVTFVSRLSLGVYLEHAFSYYPGPDRFDLTPGHRQLPSGNAMEAAGQSFRVGGSGDPIVRCFQCHSTGPAGVSVRQEITINEEGVRCEVCHGPGERHVRAATVQNLGQIRAAIQNPRAASASEVLRLCGTCHRPPDGREASNDFANPWNVRHQPPYLQQSKCFQESEERLSCFTCHEPHGPLRRSDAAYYKQKCLTCHTAGQGKPPSNVCFADPKSDCTGCHMPTVTPDPNLRFRNHWIGVYRSETNLIPSR